MQNATNVVSLNKPFTNADVIAKFEKLKRAQRRLKTLQRIYEELKDYITDYMGDDEILYDAEGGTLATYKTQERFEFSKDALEALQPGLYDQCKRATTRRVFLSK